jgi:hypothetical protein
MGMRVSGRLAGLGPALLLAACVAPAGPAPEGVARVRAEPRPDVAAPAARGETALLVRAVPAGTSGQELRGAACRAESAYFTAEFASPAQILMPDFGEAAPVVTVTCRSGEAAGTAMASPERAWSGGLGGWPAVGISVGTGDVEGVGVGVGWYGGSVGRTAGTPVVRYRELRVPLS